MSNRFATIALTILASIVGVFVLFVISLFIFPGAYLFGVKYVALNTHAGTSFKFEIKDRVGNFSGIIVNAYEVPVNVIFTGNYAYEMEYVDNFNGLTTSNIDNPSYSVEKDDMGNAVISISEYHTLIYESSTSERYVNLYIPLGDVSTSKPYGTSLTINSTKSPIKFQKEESLDVRIPKFNNVSIKTNGTVSFNDKVMATTYTYDTNNSILIDEAGEKSVVATNYNLISKLGNIIIDKDVDGDLKLSTDQGKIALRSCKNLTAETRYGNICFNARQVEDENGEKILEEGSITVGGIVKINSRAGAVTLGKVKGQNGQNEITTTSGNVKIERIYDGSVTTQRGSINIESVRIFTAKSNSGKINITEVTSSIDAETARGSINLGSESKYVSNPKVFSRIGKVNVQSAAGTVDIETLSSDVKFINASREIFASKELKIVCGGELYAEGLMGKVDIKCEKNITLSFTDLSQENTTILLGKSCQKAQVNALSNYKNEINYVLIGKMVYIQENQNNTIVTLEQKDRYETNVDSPYVFKISGENATVNICFKSQAEN